ncbi:hypothetical protein VAEKB19_6260002 [Vibrio aestuarianus]|nr:hypothetical protein VAEKB19_6260002 [Vibrio aestuarianus]
MPIMSFVQIPSTVSSQGLPKCSLCDTNEAHSVEMIFYAGEVVSGQKRAGDKSL